MLRPSCPSFTLLITCWWGGRWWCCLRNLHLQTSDIYYLLTNLSLQVIVTLSILKWAIVFYEIEKIDQKARYCDIVYFLCLDTFEICLIYFCLNNAEYIGIFQHSAFSIFQTQKGDIFKRLDWPLYFFQASHRSRIPYCLWRINVKMFHKYNTHAQAHTHTHTHTYIHTWRFTMLNKL